MFKKPFSFEGRIRRMEYGLSVIIYAVAITFLRFFIQESYGEADFLIVAAIPLFWFLIAQNTKRCHDVGNSGWWQLIPFYGFWLLFQEGDQGINEYGEDPKGTGMGYQTNTGSKQTNYPSSSQQGTGGTYQGSYDGGHNNPNSSTNGGYSPTNNPGKGYTDGSLYN